MLFILKYIPYVIILNLVKLCERIAWNLGLTSHVTISEELAKPKKGDGFTVAVQKRRIIWKNKLSALTLATPNNFISWPSGVCDYTAILKDNVSMYCITESEAWFVETQPEIDVYSSDSDPFLYISQFKHAQRLYVITLETLIALGEFLGDPTASIVLISSHGRCGSTLLTQVFETVPGALTLGEPDVLSNPLWFRWTDKRTTDQLRLILPAVMKVLCRKMANREVSLYCIKTRSVSVTLVDIIAETMPKIKHLYLYRNCADSVVSMQRSFVQGTEIGRFLSKILQFKLFQKFIYWMYPDMPEGYSTVTSEMNKRYKAVFNMAFMASATPLGFWTVNWGMTCAEYLRLRKAGIDIAGIRYEDLTSSTELAVRGLSKHTGIELEPKVIIEEVMKKDSQRGTLISKDKLDSFHKLVPDEKTKVEMQHICNTLGLPDPSLQTVFEGTIAVNA